MLSLITAVFTWLQSFVRSRHDLGLEIVALRHQLIVLKRRTKRPRLHRSDRLFWILQRHFWQALGQIASDCEAGNRGWVASAGFPSILAFSLPEQNGGKADNIRRYSVHNPDDGTRKTPPGVRPASMANC